MEAEKRQRGRPKKATIVSPNPEVSNPKRVKKQSLIPDPLQGESKHIRKEDEPKIQEKTLRASEYYLPHKTRQTPHLLIVTLDGNTWVHGKVPPSIHKGDEVVFHVENTFTQDNQTWVALTLKVKK